MTQNDAFSRRVRVRVFLHEQQRQKAPDPIPPDSRRRWYRLHLDRARLTNNQEGETPTDAYSFRPHLRMRPRALISLALRRAGSAGGRARLSAFHRGACDSEPTPPFSSSTRFLGRGRRAQSRWFERPCAVARALPAPSCPSPASSSQAGHGAGRAFCRSRPRAAVTSRRPQEPHSPPATGVTRRPSCKLSEIRDVCIRNADQMSMKM
jgi:hypothetical protein